jgi:hypothetical protein
MLPQPEGIWFFINHRSAWKCGGRRGSVSSVTMHRTYHATLAVLRCTRFWSKELMRLRIDPKLCVFFGNAPLSCFASLGYSTQFADIASGSTAFEVTITGAASSFCPPACTSDCVMNSPPGKLDSGAPALDPPSPIFRFERTPGLSTISGLTKWLRLTILDASLWVLGFIQNSQMIFVLLGICSHLR